MNEKIFIWGSYEYGNYGDDIMAIYFGHMLTNIGYEVVVYRLNTLLADKYKLKTTWNLDEGLSGAVACFLGGGALFNKYPVNDVYNAYRTDVYKLSCAIHKYEVNTYGLSIGAGGLRNAALLSDEQRHLLHNEFFRATTVRAEADLALFDGHADATYLQDVVVAISRGFEVKANQRTLILLVNLPRLPYIDPFFCLLWKLYAKVHRVDVVLHSTYSDGSKIRQTEHGYGHGLVGFEDPLAVIKAYGGTNTSVLSYKLHFGMSFMSSGANFISFKGKPKTQIFLREHGLAGNIIGFWGLLLGFVFGFHRLKGVRSHFIKSSELDLVLNSYEQFIRTCLNAK